MSEADLETPGGFTVTGGLTITDGITVTGGTIDFSGATSSNALTLTDLSASTAAAGTTGLAYDNTTGVFTYTPPDLSSYATTASLANVATSGAYADITGTPTLATVATSGAYADLTGTPSLSGYLTDITGESLSDLSDVASTAPTDGQVLTYDTTNGWQPETLSSGSSVPWADISAFDNTSPTTPGNSSMSLGYVAAATGDYSISLGYKAKTSGNYAINISSGPQSGTIKDAAGNNSIVIGNGETAGQDAISIGIGASVDAGQSIALGRFASVGDSTYTSSVAIGNLASATQANQIMLGGSTISSVRVGNSSYAPSDNMDLATKAYVDANAGGGSSGGLGSYGVANSTGTAASATGIDAIAIGETSSSTAGASVAIGSAATSGNDGGVALGLSSTVNGNRGIALGQEATGGTVAIGLGYQASATGNYSTAIGYSAATATANQLMLGDASNTTGYTSIRVGNTSYTPSDNMDLATKAYVDSAAGGGGLPSNIAVSGTGTATATGSDSVAIGNGATTAAYFRSIAIGLNASAQSSNGYTTAIGYSAYAHGNSSIAIGEVAEAYNDHCIAIGRYSDAVANYSISLGSAAVNGSSSTGSIAIGWGATNSRDNQVTIGKGASTGNYVNGGVSIGAYSVCNGVSSVAVGTGYSTSYHTSAYGSGQAFGAYAYAQSNGTAVGYQAYQTGSNATAVGIQASASGTNATAIGNGANANASNKFVLGNSSITDLRCQDTSISAVSDRRDKTNIEALAVGLDFVNAIEPKAFYKNNRNDYYVGQYTREQLNEDLDLVQTYTFDQEAYEAATHKFDKREFGFIAQDVAEQLPEQYSDARVSFPEIDDLHGFEVQRFTMGDMTPILWKALRELSDKHDQLQSDYDALLARVVALENA
jgi:hypothetical protein